MAAEVEWRRLSAAALRDRADADAIVLLPVASTEQHGPHLPTGVDDFLCTEVCRRTAMLLDGRGVPAVVAPGLPFGLAEHHMAFGGSFTLSLATYRALLLDLCRSIGRAGFARLVIVNGHGGNMSALAALNVDLTRELHVAIATTTYFVLAEAAFRAILDDQDAVLHACEAETSMMMAIRPDLVDAGRLPDAVGPPFADARAILSPPIQVWRSFRDLTASGVIGDARRASAEKGERLLEAAALGLADRLARGEPWLAQAPATAGGSWQAEPSRAD